MLIRPFEEKDEEQCLLLGEALLQESSLRFLPMDRGKVSKLLFDSILFPEDSLCLVAELDGKLVGYFFGRMQRYYFCDELMATDLWVYVSPEHRGSKAATGFIKKFNVWAEAHGAREVMVSPSTGIQTDRTVAWLNHMAFETSGVMTKRRV